LENLDKEKFIGIPVYVSKNGELFTGENLLKSKLTAIYWQFPISHKEHSHIWTVKKKDYSPQAIN